MAGLPSDTPLDYWYGDSFSGVSVVWKDANGTPINLTGYLASLQVRDENDVLVLHLDSAGQTGLTIDALNGKVSISATAPKMVGGTLVQGTVYDYDLQVKSGDGNTIRTLLYGKFVVHEQATEV